MATLLLSAAGAAVGAGFGGSVLGLSGAVIGRAIGATVGRVIDQRLLGQGSRAVETGRIDRFRLTGASEGAALGRVWGRMRVAGQVIWASRFRETATQSGGGKGAPKPANTEYSYTVSLAVALCEGEIRRVGRVWADGVEIAPRELVLRVHRGGADQLPDPKIEAVEGAGNAPAYRGIAYVVIEDLALARFGNRVPQFSFEVMRPAQGPVAKDETDLAGALRGVALIPGTGEYALATTPVYLARGLGRNVPANLNSPAGQTDVSVALDALAEELPNCGSALVVVSWFGSDLRCSLCSVMPKVEDRNVDGTGMPWRAGGIGRISAEEVARIDDRPAYGGTPADQAVIEGIAALKARGIGPVFYPFLLMDQTEANSLTDPWTGEAVQPAFPWRGRITLSVAPERPGSPDRTAAAEAEVAAFFGTAMPGHFTRTGTTVSYNGPAEWSYRRFILHYAHLCAAAGGVDAFVIGSEMRGLTQIRGSGDSFPAVAALRALAADVRSILGPSVRISYAADWSEYWGYLDAGGNRYFHLDPLWADPAIDFVGIDNYMPLSDWRDGARHTDAGWGSVYALDYLKANIEGGEGYDWYYASPEHRQAQIRTPIADGAHGEPWVFRYKDLRAWWANPHHERIGDLRQSTPTSWVPQSKPIWFTEFGCPAVDKGTNEPNKFVDPKSSESSLPHFSSGRRDDLIQMQYLRAVMEYWSEPERNPVSVIYGAAMLDLGRTHVWAWDSRPFPQFPGNYELWSDGENYRLGHWLSGRATAQPLSRVVGEICALSGLTDVDVEGVYGVVRGYAVAEVTSARSALQALMLAYGFEAIEAGGRVTFRMRGLPPVTILDPAHLALTGETAALSQIRASDAEQPRRVRLGYVADDGNYETRVAEATAPDAKDAGVAASEVALLMTASEGQAVAERWLVETAAARDAVRLTLPPSMGWVGAGDQIEIAAAVGKLTYRIDRAEVAGAIDVEATRTDSSVYVPSDEAEVRILPRPSVPPAPVTALFLDLPVLGETDTPQAPYLAATAEPWPGGVALYASDADDGYVLNRTLERPAAIGITETILPRATAGLWDRGPALRLRLTGGAASSADPDRVLNGANAAAIGDGSSGNWEVFQFARATLVGPDTYDLEVRLRGQAGSDTEMPLAWPAGSYVVLLNGAPEKIALAPDARDLARYYRYGPSRLPPDDATYQTRLLAFRGNGLRPLSPAHLRARKLATGDVAVGWIRRTRIDGDSWSGLDVPLGETSELYLVRIEQGGGPVREAFVTVPFWTYSAQAASEDGVSGNFDILVAQVSDGFGPGLFARITMNG
jgi:hypothetical protein